MPNVNSLNICKTSLETLKERIIKHKLHHDINNKYKGLAMSFLNVILKNVKDEFSEMMSANRKSHFREIVDRMLDLHLAREIEHYGPFIETYEQVVPSDEPKFPYEFTNGMIELCTRTRAHLMAILTAWKARASRKLPEPFVNDELKTPRENMDELNGAVLALYYFYELTVRIKDNLKPIFDGVKEDIGKVDEVKNVLEDANVSINVDDIRKLNEVWPSTLDRYKVKRP